MEDLLYSVFGQRLSFSPLTAWTITPDLQVLAYFFKWTFKQVPHTQDNHLN